VWGVLGAVRRGGFRNKGEKVSGKPQEAGMKKKRLIRKDTKIQSEGYDHRKGGTQDSLQLGRGYTGAIALFKGKR